MTFRFGLGYSIMIDHLPTKFEKHLERKAPICYNFMVLTDEAP